jgi:hypothetical protein
MPLPGLAVAKPGFHATAARKHRWMANLLAVNGMPSRFIAFKPIGYISAVRGGSATK